MGANVLDKLNPLPTKKKFNSSLQFKAYCFCASKSSKTFSFKAQHNRQGKVASLRMPVWLQEFLKGNVKIFDSMLNGGTKMYALKESQRKK